MHDRKSTEESILQAVDRIIKHKGFSRLGINAVAKEAGVSKVLIYRYFGDFDGLLEAWALRNSYWINMGEESLKVEDLSSGMRDMILGLANGLHENPAKREVLRWLLAEETEVGKKVMQKNEERGVFLTESFKRENALPADLDLNALIALVTAGVNYLAIISDRTDVYNGIPLHGSEGWQRIADCLAGLVK